MPCYSVLLVIRKQLSFNGTECQKTRKLSNAEVRLGSQDSSNIFKLPRCHSVSYPLPLYYICKNGTGLSTDCKEVTMSLCGRNTHVIQTNYRLEDTMYLNSNEREIKILAEILS